jgi:mRNA interferase RelE/StbE
MAFPIIPSLLSPISRPPGVQKLRGAENQWRLRVGDYRVVYEIDDRQRTIDIVRIRHRREVYR